MRTTGRGAQAAHAAILAALLALGRVTDGLAADPTRDTPETPMSVVFVHPERFADVKDGAFASDTGKARILDELGQFMREAGQRHVPAGFSVEVRVTEVDLAGDFEAWRGPQFERVRVYRDIYSPRIDLEFLVTDDEGRLVREGRRSLRDLSYLQRAVLRPGDPLRFEKDMLRDWFRGEFAVRADRLVP